MTPFPYVAALAVICVSSASVALGDVETYTIDPTRSSLTLSGTANGIPIQAQTGASGSLTTSYAGSITVDRDFTNNTAEITNAAIAAQNTGASALIGGPANYGYIAPSSDGSQLVLWGAISGFAFSLSSPTINSPSDFDSSTLMLTTSSGEMDYGVYLQEGPRIERNAVTSMPNILTLQSSSASFAESDGFETLLMPIETDLTLEFAGPPGAAYPFDGHLSGTIVATATVPEPTSIAIFGISAFLLLHRRF